MLPFHQTVADEFLAVNALIIEQLHSDVELVENIGHHLIEAGGKRLRPLMVLLTTRALNYTSQPSLHLAAIIEFIHTATLLHDDVVDTSNLRRGRPTANAQWGNAPSVLVGDFLYSRAFQMMVAIGNMDIMAILSNTTNVIAEGEVQQLINAKNPDLTEAGYLDVIKKKTAVLFAAAGETAAVLANAGEKERQAIKDYGLHIGIAFQLVDDALDYQGDAETLGKNIGADLSEGKPTLPLIYAMEKGTNIQKQLIRDAIEQGDASQLAAIVSIVKETGALEYTFKSAQKHVDIALTALNHLPKNPYQAALQQVAEFAIARSY